LASPLTADQREALATARRAAKSGAASPVHLETVLSPGQLQVYAQWQADDQALAILRGVVPNLRHPTTAPPIYSRATPPAPPPP
jgi:hypothetical protein